MHRLTRYERLGKILVDYKWKRTRGRILPLRLWVELTNKCNLKCPVCPQSSDQKTVRGFMEWDLYRKIIDEVRDFAYDLNLSHRGESLFHPQLCDFVRYAHQAGLKTRIHSNGTMLNADLARELIDSGLDFLSFSFDGFNREDYESHRIGANYDETLSNILTFLKIKKQLNSRVPFTVIQVIQTDANPYRQMTAERNRFLKLFEGLPLNKLYIKDPHNWGGIIVNETAARIAENQPFSPCTFCWYALTVLWDGTVVPCPQDFFALLKMGDVRRQSIREIWRSKLFTEFRQNFVSRTIMNIKPCETCDRLFRKNFMGIPTANMKEFLVEHVIGYRHLDGVYRKRWQKTGK